MGFPAKFTNWIFECISTATFSVSVNGASAGFFKSTKGLRQGDPLSPYLFVLAMEVISRLLKPRYKLGLICYHRGSEELEIMHLMFADDVMVFFDGSTNSLHGITETLDGFASWSGLQMNQEKTELFHSGLNQAESTTIARYGFPIGSLPIIYLGLPLMSRKLRIDEYDGVKCRGFYSAKTWSVLRPSDTKKDWCNAIWFKGATPKHAFLMWISQLDRLPTQMRLVSWGMAIPKSCCLCNLHDETRHHLFSLAPLLWTFGYARSKG